MIDSNDNTPDPLDPQDPLDPFNPFDKKDSKHGGNGDIFNKKFSYDDACSLDKLLFSLSMYEVCNGMMKAFTTQEEYSAVQVKAVEKSNYYKRMIQLGEFSIYDIMDVIVDKYSALPFVDMRVNLNSDESISRMMNIFELNVINRENVDNKLLKLKEAEKYISEYLKNYKMGGLDGKKPKKDDGTGADKKS